jgi:hypothetical protein
MTMKISDKLSVLANNPNISETKQIEVFDELLAYIKHKAGIQQEIT